MMLPTSQLAFYDCLVPAGLIDRVSDQFKLPGAPYLSVHYLNTLPKESANQFLLVIAEIPFQVWKVCCVAMNGEEGLNLKVIKGGIRSEPGFHLRREQILPGLIDFSRSWCRHTIIFQMT